MHARRMVVAAMALCTLFVSVSMLPDAIASEGPREPAKPLAEMAVGASRVDWQPAGDYEHLTLTVAGPEGLWFRQEFAAGQPASLSLINQAGQLLPDGAYAYELRIVPRKAGSLPERSLLQAGSFVVRDGSFAAAFEEIEPPARKAPAATRVIHDKLVTAANECIGALCVAGDDAGPPILRLKDYRGVGIWFNDTPDSFSHSRDWLLQANPNPFTGGLQHFFLQDMDAGTIPFSVQGQAPDFSLVVGGDSVVGSTGGNIGVGTALPAQAVHVARTDTPTLRFEDTYTGTFPGIRIWDIGANATELFVQDVTGSSSMPFRIQAGAPTDSLRVSSTGQVGIGTASPAAALGVSRSTGAIATLARFSNNAGIQVLYDRTDAGASDWQTSNWSGVFQISIPGSTTAQFDFYYNGNMVIGGTQYLTNSSRNLKENFVPVDGVKILQRLVDMPLAEWNAKIDPSQRHIGPVAEDWWATFRLGPDDKHVSPTDIGGVALAAIKGLHQILAAKEAEIVAVRDENANLAQRLAVLEDLVLKNRRDADPETELSPAP